MRMLTHCGLVMPCIVKYYVIIGLDDCLLLVQSQAIIWTNAELLSIRHLGATLNEIWMKI